VTLAKRLAWFLLCVGIGACSRREPSLRLSIVSSSASAAPGSAPALDDLTEQLRSPDETVRYSAAARAFNEPDASRVSADARNALFDILGNAKEREGVRLWAARTLAKLEPERALKRFVELTDAGLPVDGDAWITLGPRALPTLAERCAPSDCPDPVFTELTLIVESAPSHDDSRKAIPLLLRESTRSEQRKALAYRAFGVFGSSLVPELELLRNHDDPAMRKAATEALAAIRRAP
jgi:HEAT repeat protein